jgi:hypothetical protein
MKSYVPITTVILCLSFLISSLQYSNMVSQVVVQGQEEDDGDTQEEVEEEDDTQVQEEEDDTQVQADDDTLDDDDTQVQADDDTLDDDTQVQADENVTQVQEADGDTQEEVRQNVTESQVGENVTQSQVGENVTQVGPCPDCVVSNDMISSFIDEDGQTHDTVVSKPSFEPEGDKTRLAFGISNLPKGKSGDFTLEVPHSYFSNITGASVGGKEVDIMVEGDPTITIPLEDTGGQEVVQIFGVRAPEEHTSSGNYRISYNWVPLRQNLSEAILLGINEAPYHALTVTFWSEETSTVISSGEFYLTIRRADPDRDDGGDEFTTMSNLHIKDDGSSEPLKVDFSKDIDEVPNEYDVEVTLTEVDGETLGRPDDAVLQRVRVDT